MSTTGRSASELGGLCALCGLCCDGSFFRNTRLGPSLLVAFRSAHRSVVDGEEAWFASQPCAQHRGDHCAIYERRPSVCARYRCRVLERAEAAQLDASEAARLIVRARALAAEARAALGVESHEPLMRKCNEFLRGCTSLEDRQRQGERLLTVLAYVHKVRDVFGVGDGEPEERTGPLR